MSALGTAEKKLVPETNNIGGKLFQEKTSFALANTTSIFTTSWSSGALPSSKTPIFFGRSFLGNFELMFLVLYNQR